MLITILSASLLPPIFLPVTLSRGTEDPLFLCPS